MPSALKYIPPTDVNRNIFRVDVFSERQKRRDDYREAIKYYEGKHDQQLTIAKDTVDHNVIINMVKVTADRTSTFLFPEMPRFEIDPTSIQPTDEEKYLAQFFEANGGLSKLVKMAIRGFLSGHVFCRVKPAPEGLRDKQFPRFIVLDPSFVSVYWKADDVADVLWYELRYVVGNTVRLQDFVYQEDTDTWKIFTYEGSVGDDTNGLNQIPTPHGEPDNAFLLDDMKFNVDVFKLINTAEHTSHIPPIIDFAHLPHPDDYFGMNEANQKTLQDNINRIASEINRIVGENADPVDVVTGAEVEDVKDKGGFVVVGQAGSKVTRLELRSDLPGIKSILEKLMETYLAVARVVLLKGEAKDLQRVTNASVRTLFLDALAKNSILQSSYGLGMKAVAELALMMGFEAGHKLIKKNPSELEVIVVFSEALPTDMTEIANINAIQVNMGARSLRTAATEIGDKWEFEQSAMEAEHELDMARKEEQLELEDKFTPDEPPANIAP